MPWLFRGKSLTGVPRLVLGDQLADPQFPQAAPKVVGPARLCGRQRPSTGTLQGAALRLNLEPSSEIGWLHRLLLLVERK